MGAKVLALIESNIGMRYTLDARLSGLGFQVTVLTAPEAFEKRLASEAFDWIILDAAAMQPHPRRFLERLEDRRRAARVVWCGELPRHAPARIEAIFDKPLRYDDLARFFSRWAAAGRPESADSGARQTEAPQSRAGDSTAAAPMTADEEAKGGGEE